MSHGLLGNLALQEPHNVMSTRGGHDVMSTRYEDITSCPHEGGMTLTPWAGATSTSQHTRGHRPNRALFLLGPFFFGCSLTRLVTRLFSFECALDARWKI